MCAECNKLKPSMERTDVTLPNFGWHAPYKLNVNLLLENCVE
jgi:hypothetical protein